MMESEFSEKELVLIDLLADPTDTRSKEEKAEACGFSAKYVYELQKQPGWKNAVYQRMKQYVFSNLPRVYGSLLTLATKEKDIKAAELLLKAAGEIQSAGVQVHNVLKQGAEGKDDNFIERLRAAQEARQRRTLEARRMVEERNELEDD